MSRLFSRLSLACVAACSAAAPSSSAWAQDDSSNPTVVVAIAPLDKMLQDLSYVMRASGAPEVSGMATTFIRAYSVVWTESDLRDSRHDSR